MRPVLSATQQRAFDRHAAERCRVPGLLLMENAGRGAAEALLPHLGRGALTVVVTGAGNNGGDGYVVARRLLTLGHAVLVVTAVDPTRLTGDAAAQREAFLGVGGAVQPLHEGAARGALAQATVVVDALLGTGLDRPVEGALAEAIALINASAGLRVALDLPSGLHADRGVALGAAVLAHRTLTFGHLKLGLCTTAGAEHAGAVTVVDIGVPPALVAAVGHAAELVEAAEVTALLAPRAVSAHKGSAGRVVIIGGAPGKGGAALLAGVAALRAGAGLVTLASFEEGVGALSGRVPEVMTAALDPFEADLGIGALLATADAVVVGPGLGLDERARAVVEALAVRFRGPLLLDADALTLLGADGARLQDAGGPRLLTPHPGEAARLLGRSAEAVEADRFEALLRLVEVTGSAVLLKGPRTLVGAPGELPRVNDSGHPALATAGAGDVLAGLAGALLGRLTAFEAGWAAAHVHGLCGRRWAERHATDRGLLAHEVADELPAVLGSLIGGARGAGTVPALAPAERRGP